MKLYDIPDGSKLRVFVNGSKDKSNATFHHIDGMYSLCSIDGMKGDNYFHLSASTPMKLVEGFYEIEE